jgi:hypothetical protein
MQILKAVTMTMVTCATQGEAHGHPHSPGPVCDLSAFPSSEVGLPHVFSKQLSDLSSVGPETTNSEYPFIDFGLASSPKSQLLKIAKTQKP